MVGWSIGNEIHYDETQKEIDQTIIRTNGKVNCVSSLYRK